MIQQSLNFGTMIQSMVWPWPMTTVTDTLLNSSEEDTVEFPSAVEQAMAQGIRIMHCIDDSAIHLKGCTIAYRKISQNKNTRMVEVAVVYCSSYDNFSKKTGAALATQRFLKGQTVVIPARMNGADQDMLVQLRRTFWYDLV